ncbi:ankyrin [Piromyces finnis]|uniref:Ankyrin n=1 Tax=Piromyces finnis TaxID=1754191 RepID=A0A1Y1VPI7_9FUNG|nr:ankyrin [Piromyces finnis]|eukprot:ORX61170.1 ankyrin [Piromyces finnis]
MDQGITENTIERGISELEQINPVNKNSKREQLLLTKKLIILILQNRSEEIISQFIETSSVDINYFNNEYNPLFQVLKRYQYNESVILKLVNILNNFGINYNAVWKDGYIPLFEFLKLETFTCLKLLKLARKSGANMYQLDGKKRNLFMYSIEINVNVIIIKYLLSLNYNMSIQDINGNTIYMYATLYHYNLNNSYGKILPYLLENFIFNNDIIISLILMGKNKRPASIQNIINIIKSNNELINIKNNEGDNTLFIAIKNHFQPYILTYLMQLGSRIDEVDNNGNSPLILATAHRNFKSVNCIMYFHPNLNLKNKNNDTALTIAVRNNDINIVKLLLNFCSEVKESEQIIRNKKTIFSFRSKSIDDFEDEDTLNVKSLDNTKNLKVNEQNNDGETALSLAIKNENKEMVYNLLTCGADPSIVNNKKETALINAVQINNERIVDLILNAQDDINGVDENHDTAIIIAVRNGNYEIVKKLVERNADITIRDKDQNTPLMIAVCNECNYMIVKKLLTLPENTLYEIDKNGKTAFLLSILNNCPKIAALLIESGASISDIDTDSKNNNALLLASKYGNYEIVSYLVKNKSIDIDSQNKNLNTSLIKASKKNNVDIVRFLLRKGANPETKNKNGNTALIVACLQKNMNIIECLITYGANIECYNNEGFTPLILACQNNDASMADTFINKYNAKINYTNPILRKEMDKCFIKAVESGYFRIVKLLLKCGYIIDISNKNNNYYKLLVALINATNSAFYRVLNEILPNPYFEEVLKDWRNSEILIFACRNSNRRIIDLLLKYEVNVNVRDKYNNTALIELSSQPYLFNYIKELIKRNAEINVINNEGISALLNSCKELDSRIFKYLINKGANFYLCDFYGNNALMYACSYGDIDKIKFLLKRHININTQNNDGETALMQSVRAGKAYIVKFLLRCRANVNILNRKNQSALIIGFLTFYEKDIVDNNDIDIIKMLILKKADLNVPIDTSGNSILMFLIMKNDISTIKYLSKLYFRQIDFSHKNYLGHNAFTYALKCNNQKIINFLISTNKVNAFDEDDNGNDMIMYTICNTNVDYFKKLSEYLNGSMINKCNYSRESYLIMATKVNNEKIIDILLDKGIDVDHQESQGNTALHYAALQDNMATIEKLIKYGANLEIQNYKGETPLMVACRFKQQNAIKTLLDNGAQSLFVDNVIYSKEKSFDFKQNQDLYIEMMIEYYNDISAIVPDNYMSNITLLKRMEIFYKPASFKSRFEDVEDIIKDGLEEIFENWVDSFFIHNKQNKYYNNNRIIIEK